MTALALGDKVAVRKHDGRLAYEDVYAFGHRDASATAAFADRCHHVRPCRRKQKPRAHSSAFRPNFVRGWRKSCAQDVIKGDRIWTQGASNVSDDRIATDSLLYVVARISQIEKQGLYNPFTLSGTIVVNGVVASSHSDWFLDSFFQFFNLVHWLPAAYQLVLFPVRMLYYGLGKTVYITLYQRLDTLVDISKFAGKHGGGIAATVCAATGLVAILALSKVSMRSQSRRQ